MGLWAPRGGTGEAQTWEGEARPDTCPDSCRVPVLGALGRCPTMGTLGCNCLIKNLIWALRINCR